ncbi:MAG: SGNH/GDSL hydrolase family protein [Oscillospiraceae bacterium]|nr:SGNH/GDSL hydrolase family protein [Oscillospiraceae bacterium]
MLFEQNGVLLMIGDSITDCGRERPVGRRENDGLGSGYVNFVNALLTAKFPESKIKILNTAVSGDTTRHLKARWQTDVIDLSPDYLSIKIGVNDVWRKFDSPRDPSLAVGIAEYEANYRELIALTKEKTKVKKIILITPFLAETDRTEPMMAEILRYTEVVKKIACENNLLLVDLQPEFDRYMLEFGIEPKELAGDRVHPSQTGGMIIAGAFLKVCGVDIL